MSALTDLAADIRRQPSLLIHLGILALTAGLVVAALAGDPFAFALVLFSLIGGAASSAYGAVSDSRTARALGDRALEAAQLMKLRIARNPNHFRPRLGLYPAIAVASALTVGGLFAAIMFSGGSASSGTASESTHLAMTLVLGLFAILAGPTFLAHFRIGQERQRMQSLLDQIGNLAEKRIRAEQTIETIHALDSLRDGTPAL